MGVRLHPRLRAPHRTFQLVSCHDPNSMIPPIPELGPPPRPAILLLYAMKGERGSQDLSALYANGGFSIRLVGADVALKTMESRNPSSGTQQVRLAGRDGWLSWRDERRWWASDPPRAVATLIEWHVRPSPLPLSATLYGYFDRRLALGLARDVAEALSLGSGNRAAGHVNLRSMGAPGNSM